MKKLLCLTLMVFQTSLMFAQTDDEPNEAFPSPGQGGSYSKSGSVGDTWYQEVGSEKPVLELPEFEIQKRLQVNWLAPTIDELGNVLTLAGQLVDPNSSMPITWQQPITVAVAVKPESKLGEDWGMYGVSLHDCVLTSETGNFSISLRLRNFKRDRLKKQVHYVTIALGKSKSSQVGRIIRWTSEDEQLDLNSRTIEIPPNPKIDQVQVLLNDASRHGYNYNPIPVIAAVNALHALGKQNALEELEKHLKLLQSNGDTFEGNHLFTIVRLLFEPIDPTARIPVPMNFESSVYDKNVSPEWPLNPIELVEGIPFKFYMAVAGSGQPEPPESHLEFAKQACVLRDRPLTPAIDPITAANSLCESQKIRRLSKYEKKSAIESIRHQAISMLPRELRDDDWGKLTQSIPQLKLKWSSESGFQLPKVSE